MFRHAIVRPPTPNFARGLTTAGLGAPDLAKALEQLVIGYQRSQRCGHGVRVGRLEHRRRVTGDLGKRGGV